MTGEENPELVTFTVTDGLMETGMLGRTVKCSSLVVWADEDDAEATTLWTGEAEDIPKSTVLESVVAEMVALLKLEVTVVVGASAGEHEVTVTTGAGL